MTDLTTRIRWFLLAGALAGCAKAGMGADVRADITARMQSASGPIATCYAGALQQHRKLAGMMVLDLAAAPDTGQFTDITVRHDELSDPALRQCVIAAVGQLRLAKPQSARVTIDYPIHFEPNN